LRSWDEYNSDHYVTIDSLREKTGTSFVAARDVIQIASGVNYQSLEYEVESRTHRLALERACNWFISIGYNVFPEGIGVEGEFTFADFLAIRDNRIVFVECLTDYNTNKDVVAKKTVLSNYGEICFVLISSIKEFCSEQLSKEKMLIAQQADVLYFRSYGSKAEDCLFYGKSFPLVAFAVGAERKIYVELQFNNKKSVSIISIDFLIEQYCLIDDYPIFDNLYNSREENCKDLLIETIHRISKLGQWEYKIPRKTSMLENAMRRKAGIKVLDDKDNMIASASLSTGKGCLTIKGVGSLALDAILTILEEKKLTPIYNKNELDACRNVLVKQDVTLGDPSEKMKAKQTKIYEKYKAQQEKYDLAFGKKNKDDTK